MLVTLSGMVILVRLVQRAKALSPMLVTLSGMVMLVRLVQRAKALYLMLVTLLGIVYEVSDFPLGYLINSVFFLLNRTPLLLE